ncbi:MAG: hypothetical protein IPL83_02465 [Bdellovibrionales bacterium]|nr:hypothetical protein [Bdellovibrionales bacterium]
MKRSAEEERIRVQIQKVNRQSWDFFPTRSHYRNHSGAGLAIALPIILVFFVIAAVPLYLVWVVRQAYSYPKSRRTFLRQELLRLSWILSVVLVPYSIIDAIIIKNHVYLSLLGIPLGIWMSLQMKKKFRVAAKTQKYEEKKSATRHRRKLAKQQPREQRRSDSAAS